MSVERLPSGGRLLQDASLLGAMRKFCLECQGGENFAVAACRDRECPLYGERNVVFLNAGKRDAPCDIVLRGLSAVRRQCLSCAGDSRSVSICDAQDVCSLWVYRFGVLPEAHVRVRSRSGR